jgi:hypothetical protein
MGTTLRPFVRRRAKRVWRNAERSTAGQRSRLVGLALRPGFRLKARSPSNEPSGRGRRHELRQTEFELQGQRCLSSRLDDFSR